jgi:hypothetical protein
VVVVAVVSLPKIEESESKALQRVRFLAIGGGICRGLKAVRQRSLGDSISSLLSESYPLQKTYLADDIVTEQVPTEG